MPCQDCRDPARCDRMGVCQQFKRTLPTNPAASDYLGGYGDALEHAAVYVAEHCQDGEQHAQAIREMKRPAPCRPGSLCERSKSGEGCEAGRCNPPQPERSAPSVGELLGFDAAERERLDGVDAVEGPSFDVEAMLRACVPGGSVCDPQQVADAIRDYFADGVKTPAAPQQWTDPEKEPRFQPGEET